MGDIAKAFVQIVPSADGISNGIKDALDGELGKSGKSSGNSFCPASGKRSQKASEWLPRP